MNRHFQCNKAIRLLDHKRDDEAIALLQTIAAECRADSDVLHYIQAICILGEYWFYQGDREQAKSLLERINTIVLSDEPAICPDMN